MAQKKVILDATDNQVQKNKGEGPDEERWTMVILRWHWIADKQRASGKVWEDTVPKESSKGPKYKWVAHVDLVQDWRKTDKRCGVAKWGNYKN